LVKYLQIKKVRRKIMEATLRSSNLLLPQGFVEMDREEMMYVDGGGTITLRVTAAFQYNIISYFGGAFAAACCCFYAGLFAA
jgi:hypothetical protein